MRDVKIGLAAAVVTGFACVANAVSATWTGAYDGHWTNALNWAGGVVPGQVLGEGDVVTGQKGDTAIFNGSETGAKTTTIDLDGLKSIGTILVNGGASAPVYTFGATTEQVIPVEAEGLFSVTPAATHVPILQGVWSLGVEATRQDWQGDYGAVLRNESAETLVVNDYGKSSMAAKVSPVGMSLTLAGPGTIRVVGNYVKGEEKYFGFHANGKLAIVDTPLGNGDVYILKALSIPSADGYWRGTVEITKNGSILLHSGMNTAGFYLQRALSIVGEGPIVMDYEHVMAICSLTTLKISAPFGTRSTKSGVKAEGIRFSPANYSSGTKSGSLTMLGVNNATGRVDLISQAGGLLVSRIAQIGEAPEMRIGNSCYLDYSGTGETAEIPIVITNTVTGDLANRAYLRQNGTGELTWNCAISQTIAQATLVLTGDGAAAGIWAGVLAERTPDGSSDATLNLTKEGTGTWRLTAANAYHGTTTISGGTLELVGAGTLGANSGVTFAGGDLVLADSATARAMVLPPLHVVDGKVARLVLGRNRSVTLNALPTRDGTGMFDISMDGPQCTITVAGQSAGALPSWITINGQAASLDADGNVAWANTTWKAAESGTWSTAAAWAEGVPTAGVGAYVFAAGEPYTVTIDGAATAQNLKARGSDVTVRVTDTGAYAANGRGAVSVNLSDAAAAQTDSSAIEDGATVTVDGGTMTLSDYAGVIRVASADPTMPSQLIVTNGGVLSYCVSTGACTSAKDLQYETRGRFEIGPGGRLEVTDGTISATGAKAPAGENDPVLVNNGGTIDVRGRSLYHVSREGLLRVFGTGTTTFRDDAVFVPGYVNQGAEVYIAPEKEGETATVTFADRSSISNYIARYFVGGTKGGDSVLNLYSSATNLLDSTGTKSTSAAYFMGVGSIYGNGTLNMTNGVLEIGSVGMVIGGDQSYGAEDHSATGTVNLSGGKLTVNGTAAFSHQWLIGYPAGVIIGQGTWTANRSGRPFKGTLNVSGGTFVSNYGHFMLGAGFAEGAFVQTGGTVTLQPSIMYNQEFPGVGGGTITRWATNSAAAVGIAGGYGRFTQRGGTFTCYAPLYVGGVQTNTTDFFLEPYMKSGSVIGLGIEFGHWPDDRHDADGKLTFAGGTFTLDKALTLGADGTGELAIEGNSGSFTVGALRFAGPTATMRFTPDATGVTPVQVTGALTIGSGAQLILDLTGTRKRKFRLFDYGSINGAFDSEDVAVLGLTGPFETTVTADADGMNVRVREHGLILIVR